MTPIGWEFFGIKFSLFVTMLVSAFIFLSVWLGSRKNDHFIPVDRMAGDEGED